MTAVAAPAATPVATAVERFVAAWREFAAAGDAPRWLREWRAEAIARFAAAGFPGPRDEAWRFTSVAPLLEASFELPDGRVPVTPETVAPFLVGAGAARHALVFVNGRLVPELTARGRLPDGVVVESLATAGTERADLVRTHLGRQVAPAAQAFAALNTAFLADGAFVHVPAGVELDEPLQLLFLTAGAAPVMVHPRVLVVLERGARVTVVESYVGLDARTRTFTNAVSEMVVGDGARLDLTRVQREGAAAFHVAASRTHQSRDSTVHATALAFGAALARHDITATLDGPGAYLALNGLSVGAAAQHLDHHTTIDHAQPHGESHELFNGVFDDRAHGVFTGRIIVRPGAQRTDSKQTNNHLLLSASARGDSQPQLEIYADDVKCTHGSTTGPLDPTALFYLKSRGLDARAANRMLTYGFGAEIVSRIEVEGVRTALDRLLRARVEEALR
jgi:Fe-S cluster assembly protein SufD